MKKQSDLSRLMGYAGNYRYFTYASWVLSAVSALVALVPFVYIWKILRDVLNAAPDYAQAVNIPHYGWMAVLFAVAVLLHLHCGADVLPSVSVPGGDQSAAGGVGASGGAAAGLCRNFWQRQAAQDHPRKHRSRRDLDCGAPRWSSSRTGIACTVAA